MKGQALVSMAEAELTGEVVGLRRKMLGLFRCWQLGEGQWGSPSFRVNADATFHPHMC